jgi:hypothetical protein
MRLRPLAKRLIAGLALVSLMFQVALVAAQLSILTAAKADAAATLPTGIICTEHGVAAPSSDQAPTDLPASCTLCPFCLTLGAGQMAILLPADFTVIEAAANGIVFHFTSHRGAENYSAQPRSRGPPTLA